MKQTGVNQLKKVFESGQKEKESEETSKSSSPQTTVSSTRLVNLSFIWMLVNLFHLLWMQLSQCFALISRNYLFIHLIYLFISYILLWMKVIFPLHSFLFVGNVSLFIANHKKRDSHSVNWTLFFFFFSWQTWNIYSTK